MKASIDRIQEAFEFYWCSSTSSLKLFEQAVDGEAVISISMVFCSRQPLGSIVSIQIDYRFELVPRIINT